MKQILGWPSLYVQKLDRAYRPVNPFLVLTHAIWHCRYGSGNVDREPDEGDRDAELILRRLRDLVISELEEENR